MIKITINNKETEVAKGTTVLEAARSLGIKIPTMCHLNGGEHFTSCMVCLVKDTKLGRLVPSCSMPVMEDMVIETDDSECHEARKAALELLMSEHVGDCEAPCQGLCPAHMDIPLMNRYIAGGDFSKANEIIKRDIAIPSILARICPAPCEAGCRRKPMEGSVSICLLKGFASDSQLLSNPTRVSPERSKQTKKIAVIGAGPAGLALAYNLDLDGFSVVIYEKTSVAGGALRQIKADILPKGVIDGEIKYLLGSSIEVNYGVEVDKPLFDKLVGENDAVVVATGALAAAESCGLKLSGSGIEVEPGTFRTSMSNVFAVGGALRPHKVAIRSVGQAKDLAKVLIGYFSTGELKPLKTRFNSKFGKLLEPEFAEYLKDAIPGTRLEASSGKAKGFTVEEAIIEAKRCLHCDCRKSDNCGLRDLAEEYGAEQKRFSYGERRMVTRKFGNQNIVFEENKCIKCGKCIQIAKEEKELFGLTFIGRGFDVRVDTPFNESLDRALQKTAFKVVENCPTGALSGLF